ncbi:MAG: condensation domain-containing protein, partial [Acidobacteriota bacterium]
MDKRNIEAIYPLSPTQRGLLLYLVVSGSDGRPSNAFFEQFHATFHGPLDPAHLRAAWEHVIERHPSLRTLFLWERRDTPVQVVLRSIDVPFVVEDWRDRSAEQQEADLEALLRAEQDRGFRLDRGPLVRFFVLRTGDETHRFVWCFSHLVLDGWSIAKVFGEAMQSHTAISRGDSPELAPAVPYRDYIAWLDGQDENEAEAFWRRTLDGSDGATSLPGDRDPGAPMTRHGARLDSTRKISRPLGRDTWDAIHTLCRNRRLTPNAFFQGVWGLLLARTTGEDDVLWGSVVSGRTPEVEGVEDIVGLFINALPVRAQIDPQRAFGEWLSDLQLQLVDQRQFEYVPVESIQRWLDMPRERPLFESHFIY